MRVKTHKAIKNAFREQMKESGAFDGRFRSSKIESKKHKLSKMSCRRYKYTQ